MTQQHVFACTETFSGILETALEVAGYRDTLTLNQLAQLSSDDVQRYIAVGTMVEELRKQMKEIDTDGCIKIVYK